MFYFAAKEAPCQCNREPESDKAIELQFKITEIPNCQGRYEWVVGFQNDTLKQNICYAGSIYDRGDTSELIRHKPISLIKVAEIGDSIVKPKGTLKYKLVKKDTTLYFFLFGGKYFDRIN